MVHRSLYELLLGTGSRSFSCLHIPNIGCGNFFGLSTFFIDLNPYGYGLGFGRGFASFALF